jgi:hypothetical protein
MENPLRYKTLMHCIINRESFAYSSWNLKRVTTSNCNIFVSSTKSCFRNTLGESTKSCSCNTLAECTGMYSMHPYMMPFVNAKQLSSTAFACARYIFTTHLTHFHEYCQNRQVRGLLNPHPGIAHPEQAHQRACRATHQRAGPAGSERTSDAMAVKQLVNRIISFLACSFFLHSIAS